jgi:polysaccharide biosynthesis/export protein
MTRMAPVVCLTGTLVAAVILCMAPLLATAQTAGVASGTGPVQQQTQPKGQADRTDYIIGPGDQLQIFVWRNPDLSATVPVRPDGRISTPLVEDMTAVGKSPSQLARDIEKVLSEYVRTPQVNVIVTQPVSTFSQVKVIGQVLHPQVIPYRDGLTVLDAILATGGLGQFAAGNRSKLVRTVDGKQVEIKLKIANLVNDGDMRQNLPLKPGDVLVIPESRF